MKTLILNNFFSAPTFCSLLTGLVRLPHLVLDQGLWDAGGGGCEESLAGDVPKAEKLTEEKEGGAKEEVRDCRLCRQSSCSDS